MGPEPSARSQGKLVGLPEIPTWVHSTAEVYHGFIADENVTRNASVNDLQRVKSEEDMFQGDPRNWNTGA